MAGLVPKKSQNEMAFAAAAATAAARGRRPSYLPEESVDRREAYEEQERFWKDMVRLNPRPFLFSFESL